MSRKWIRILATLLTLTTSSIGLGRPALAQTTAETFTIDSIARACDADRIDITWTTDVAPTSMHIALSNTSSNQSSEGTVDVSAAGAASYAFGSPANPDKVFLKTFFADGTQINYQGDTGTCGVSNVSGRQVIPPSESTTFTISGTVTNTNSTPISGAEVCAESQTTDGDTAFALCAMTGTDGSYSFPSQISQPLRFVVISVTALDYSDGFWITFEPTGNDIVQDFTLARAGGVRGVVKDDTGNAIGGVMVCIEAYKSDSCNFTDANGAFDLEAGLHPPVRNIVVRDLAWQGGVYAEPGHSLDESQVFEIVATRIENPEDQSSLDVIRVVDRNGNPINHFQVSFSNPSQMISLRSQGDSNELWMNVPFWQTPGGSVIADISIRAAGCPTLLGSMYNGIVPDHFAMDCEVAVAPPLPTVTVTPSATPTETSTPNVTPTETSTPAATPTIPPANNDGVIIQVITADDSSLEGAPFGVYAAEASTLPLGALYTGIVGANNTITLLETIPGEYVIRIAPTDGDLIEFAIEIGEDTDKLIVTLDDNDPEGSETPVITETPVATETPAATEEATKDATVDSLPNTGAGGSHSNLLLLVTAATVLAGGIAFVVRAGEARRRT